MLAIWHRPADFDCSLCADKPELRLLKGCTEPSLRPMMYPPPEIADYPGERLMIDRCPVHFLHPDVNALLSGYVMAGRRVSLAEQEALPPPVLDALSEISYQLIQMEAHSLKSSPAKKGD